MRPSRPAVMELLATLDVPPEVVSHSERVAGVAMDMARRAMGRDLGVDLWLVETGSLLHDIGRSRTHSIRHGVEGGSILRDTPVCREMFTGEDVESLARVCERHIGGGIPANRAGEAGLPPGDYVPRTLEEKIITHADNLVWNGVLTFEEGLEAFARKFGTESPIFRRISDLGREVERVVGDTVEEDNGT